jgi:hypothetical protein
MGMYFIRDQMQRGIPVSRIQILREQFHLMRVKWRRPLFEVFMIETIPHCQLLQGNQDNQEVQKVLPVIGCLHILTSGSSGVVCRKPMPRYVLVKR